MARGRPQDPAKQEQTRQALRQAARDLLETKPYRSITIRELAQQAGTQSAMVSYYFTSKEGLFINLLDQSGEQRQQILLSIVEQVRDHPERALELLVSNMIDAMSNDTWLVRLLQDEILTQQSQLREAFMDALPRRLSKGLKSLLTTLMKQGVLRSDLNLEFTQASLMSNILFPLIAEPLLKEIAQVDRHVVSSDAWKQHITLLLKQGLQPIGSASHSQPHSQPHSPGHSTAAKTGHSS